MSAKICHKCGAKCCTYFCFQIDKPEDVDEFEDIRWYLCHNGVSVHIDEGEWFISIMNRCNMLEENGQCRDYANRPLICRKYDLQNCDHSPGGYGYEEEFKSPEELEEYARRTLGAKFDMTRSRKRAGLAKKAQSSAVKAK